MENLTVLDKPETPDEKPEEKTYLEQYCTDTTLTIDQRTQF